MSGPLIPDQVIHVAASPPATPQKAAAYIRISPARYDAVCRNTVVGDGGPIRGVVVNYADAREAVGAAVNAGGWESCGLIDRDFTLAVESAARAYATGDR